MTDTTNHCPLCEANARRAEAAERLAMQNKCRAELAKARVKELELTLERIRERAAYPSPKGSGR